MDDRSTFSTGVLIGAVVLGGLFYLWGQSIGAESQEDRATITVSGDGRTFVVPDIGEISVGVQTGRQATASAAMETLKTSMDKVIAAVQEAGVEEKDIRTENFWLNPAYDWREGEQIPRGFEATQTVRVKVRNLDNVSAVLGAATAAGANQAGSVQFTVDSPEEKRAEAREEAIAEAQAQAEALADQLGVELGELIGFNEGYGGGVPAPYMREMAMGMGGGDAAAALPPGEQEIVVTVSLTYEID